MYYFSFHFHLVGEHANANAWGIALYSVPDPFRTLVIYPLEMSLRFAGCKTSKSFTSLFLFFFLSFSLSFFLQLVAFCYCFSACL